MKNLHRIIISILCVCAVVAIVFSFGKPETMKQAATLIEQALLSDSEKLVLQEQLDTAQIGKLLEVWPVLHLRYNINEENYQYSLEPSTYVVETERNGEPQYFYYAKNETRIPLPDGSSPNYNEVLTHQVNNLRKQADPKNYRALAWINVMNGYPSNGFSSGNNGGVAPIVWALCCDIQGNYFIYKDAFGARSEFLSEKYFWKGVQRFISASKHEPIYGGIIWQE